MAGGKLTPRQKMINLMYLVFIAMLALNMSKEVLSAFGLMNEKFETANTAATETNSLTLGALGTKAADNPTQFGEAKKKADQVAVITKNFYDYIGKLKADATAGVEKNADGKLPYEAMDKGDKIDEGWFSGDGYSAKGKEIVSTMDKYRADMKAVLGNDTKYKAIIAEIDSKFNTADVKDGEGVTKKYLDYNYKGFPSIASLTKLSALQNDVKVIEAELYNAFLGNTAMAAASMKNYKAFVMMDKSAFFQGEQVTGRVVLGRYDESTVPKAVSVVGASTSIENGSAVFKMAAGSVGDKDIKGKFTFMEDNKPVEIEIAGNYVVVPKPNQAIVSADKMKVVYRGVPNPISVSVPGISSDKVKASAPGMAAAGKPGQYNLTPGAGSDVTINVTATMPDGKSFSSKEVFRIKGLPSPTGKIRGEVAAKGAKSNLEVCTISAELEDFDFPVSVNVTQFNIKVPGQPTIVVSGNKMDARAKAAIAKASRGDVVVISEIKAKFVGLDQMPKRVSTCTFEVQ